MFSPGICWSGFSLNRVAEGINDAGQVVGYSLVGGAWYATEWSDGAVIRFWSVRSGQNDAWRRGGPDVIRIAITQAAFDAIAKTLPLVVNLNYGALRAALTKRNAPNSST